jgi:PKD repeat protein
MTVSIDPVSHVVMVSYPGGEWSGSETILFTALDNGDGVDDAESSSDSALFSVGAVNDPPVASNDSAICDEDGFVWIDVLTNDTDIDGTINPSTVTIITQPNDGSTNVNTTTGEIKYIPDANYYGSDSFSYTVQDDLGEVSNQATVTITVFDVNDIPTASYVYEPTNPSTSDIVYFNSTSTDVENDLENWTWNMDDGTILYGEQVTHQYTLEGNYQVELIVRDGTGATDSKIQNVLIQNIEVTDINQSIFDRGFRLMPDWFAAQEFIPGVGTLTKIDLFVSKMGIPTGEVTFQICKNKVNGTVIMETTITPDDVPYYPSYEWLTIDLDQLQVETTEHYYIVLKNATGSDTHNFIQWGWCDSYPDGAGGPYDGGWFYFLDQYGLKWSPIRDWDYTFKIYGY